MLLLGSVVGVLLLLLTDCLGCLGLVWVILMFWDLVGLVCLSVIFNLLCVFVVIVIRCLDCLVLRCCVCVILIVLYLYVMFFIMITWIGFYVYGVLCECVLMGVYFELFGLHLSCLLSWFGVILVLPCFGFNLVAVCLTVCFVWMFLFGFVSLWFLCCFALWCSLWVLVVWDLFYVDLGFNGVWVVLSWFSL